MRVVSTPSELEYIDRAVAIGTFDGVHLGHQAVLRALKGTELRSTVITFDPHPRAVLGYGVELLATVERRLELLEEAGLDEVLVIDFTEELAQLEPEQFIRLFLTPLNTRIVFAGDDFRFGRRRRGDAALLRQLGLDVRAVPMVSGVSSSRIRALLTEGNVAAAAALLGRPPEIEGVVVIGDQRGGTLGYPTANLLVDPDLAIPPYGIYAGLGLGHRAGISIGVNPHYGGVERKVEAYLLDFEGDLYGKRLRLELWQRLRDEKAFDTEAELLEQIALDVEAARSAARPV